MVDEPTDVDPDEPVRRPVEVTVAAGDAELVADRLMSLGASAVSERSTGDDVVLIADVDPAVLVGTGWRVRVLQDDPSWATAWHDTARAWVCGERLVVRPVWVPRSQGLAEGRVDVVLDPGAAFGAGSHATTRLCLTVLERFAPASRTVLDVGCGTGVLGVAALALGAGTLVAVDIDPGAVSATSRAVELNGLGDRALVSAAPLAEVRGRFDLVLANLLVPIVEELGADLVAHLAPAGVLVVSGVLAEQQDRAVAALAPLRVAQVHRDDGWVALTLVHEGAPGGDRGPRGLPGRPEDSVNVV